MADKQSANIYFFYRPRVDREVARRLDNVRRLYFVLSTRRRARVYRLMLVAEKRLPSVTREGDRTS